MGSDDDGNECTSGGRDSRGLLLLNPRAGGGAGEIKNKRAPTSLGQEVRLLLRSTSSCFYIDDGNDFYFSSCNGRRGGLLCSNTYHLLQHLLYWDAPGHVPGPLPFFTLHPPGPLQPPCFYFTINIPMKFTLSTQVELENEEGGSLKCILKRLEVLLCFLSPPHHHIISFQHPSLTLKSMH